MTYYVRTVCYAYVYKFYLKIGDVFSKRLFNIYISNYDGKLDKSFTSIVLLV